MRLKHPLLLLDWKQKKLIIGPSAVLLLIGLVATLKGIALPGWLVDTVARLVK